MSEAHKDHRLVLVVAGSHQLPGPGPGTLTVQAVMHSTPVQAAHITRDMSHQD